MSEQQTKTPNEKTKKGVISRGGCIALLVIFIFIIIVFAVISSGNKSTNPPAPRELTEQEKAQKAAEEKARQEAEAKANAPINLSGTGQQATSKFHLTKGLKIFKMTHDGSGNFAIWLIDSNGNKVYLLVNEIGSFNGSKAEQIRLEGDYLLDIAANGNWTVTIEKQ